MTNDTSEKVLRAAAELFAERGYAATTTRAIAERAGVNEVTLFRRFENKPGILRAIAEQWVGEQAGFSAEHASEPGDTLGTLRALARQEVATGRANGGVAMRLAFEARSVPEVGAVIGDGPRRNLEGLAGYMAERQAAGDLRSDLSPAVLAEAFFTLTSSFVMARLVLGAADFGTQAESDAQIDQLLALYFDGARAR